MKDFPRRDGSRRPPASPSRWRRCSGSTAARMEGGAYFGSRAKGDYPIRDDSQILGIMADAWADAEPGAAPRNRPPPHGRPQTVGQGLDHAEALLKTGDCSALKTVGVRGALARLGLAGRSRVHSGSRGVNGTFRIVSSCAATAFILGPVPIRINLAPVTHRLSGAERALWAVHDPEAGIDRSRRQNPAKSGLQSVEAGCLSRRECARSGARPAAWRTGHIRPLSAFSCLVSGTGKERQKEERQKGMFRSHRRADTVVRSPTIAASSNFPLAASDYDRLLALYHVSS